MAARGRYNATDPVNSAFANCGGKVADMKKGRV